MDWKTARRAPIRNAAVSVAILLGLSFAANAASLERGQELAVQECSGCHAIRDEGVSPNPAAPPLRDLGTRYPIDALRESFIKGLAIGHPGMPSFMLDQDDVTDLLAYLRSLDPCGKPSSDEAAMAKCFAPMKD